MMALKAIEPLARFELPPREVFSDRSAMLYRCPHCQQLYLTLYEESRAGALDSEVWNHYLYSLPAELQRDLIITATLCTTPDEDSCACPVHHLINQLDFSRLVRFDV